MHYLTFYCSYLLHKSQTRKFALTAATTRLNDYRSCLFTVAVKGHPALVTILAQFFGRLVGHEIHPLEDVLVTVGAYQALFCTFQALVDEGDEVRRYKRCPHVKVPNDTLTL